MWLAGEEGATSLLPGTDCHAALEERNVKTRKQPALRSGFISGLIAAEDEDFQSLPAPEPDLRHIELTIYLQLAEAACGESNFQREIGKLLFLMNTPRFFRLCAGMLSALRIVA